MYAPLRVHAPAFGADWPSPADWQRAFDAREPPVLNARGARLRAAPPRPRSRALEAQYEARLFLEGELELRPRNWHDCFNALAWLAFPRAKAALNARHFEALKAQRAAGRPDRGPLQDTLTLFDEGGVVVAACDPELLALIRAFRWKTLFWHARDRLAGRIEFLVFGHALHEKSLRPFKGITGRALLLEVEPALLARPLPERLAALDDRTAACLADPVRLHATRELEVLPVLGVPGWHPENEEAAFYDDQDHFRSGRTNR